MTRKQIILAPLTALVLVLGLATAAAAIDEAYAESFAFDADGRLSLDNVNGDVKIHAWDTAEVKIEYVKSARTQEGLERMEIEIDATPDRIHIETDYRESRGWFDGNHSGSVEFTIYVPRGARLDEVELVNGALELEGIEGDVAASLVNGDVDARGLGGDVEIETVNGTLEIVMDRLDPDKVVSLETVNGRLELTLPRGADADLDVETVHGKIRNDFGLEEKKGRYVGRSLAGSLGGGGARIELESVNGSISIRSQ